MLFAHAAVAQVPCEPAPDHNGSALCLQLKIAGGRVAIDSYSFAPSAPYAERRSLGPEFAAAARIEIGRLAKPCAFAMSRQLLVDYEKNPAGADAATRSVCTGDFSWREFVKAFLDWGAAKERQEEAIGAIQENGVFRSLVTLYQRSPLLWAESNNESLNPETGVMKLFVADPVDPRTSTSFAIEIEGAPNAPTRERRIAELRRWLDPLRFSVFCHDRIRQRVQEFYDRLRISAEIVQLDPRGPLLRIRERP